jgi:hypothetical protein
LNVAGSHALVRWHAEHWAVVLKWFVFAGVNPLPVVVWQVEQAVIPV